MDRKEFFVNRQIELSDLPSSLFLWYDAIDLSGTNNYDLLHPPPELR